MATAKENLEDFITCSVCLEKFEGRDPRLLLSGHAFCLTCIQDIHRTATANQDNKLKDDEFRCPQCTTMSNFHGMSVNNYPKFFNATHIHKMIQGNNPTICPRVNNEVTGYCFTCIKPFCDSCLKVHNKNRRYNNHVHVEVTTDSIQSLVCTVHDEFVEAFCTDCSKSVCKQCQLHGHVDHSTSDFVINLQHPDTPQRHIIKNKQAAKDNIRRLETMQREFNTHIIDIQHNITKHTEMMIAQITEQSMSLQAELARHQVYTNRGLENMKKRYRESDEVITQARAQIAQLTQPIPELPSVSLHNMDELIADIQQQIPQTPAGMKDVTRYQFTPQTTDVLLGYLSEIKESTHKSKPSLPTCKAPVYKDYSQAVSLSHTQGVSGTSGGAATPRPTPAAGSVLQQGLSQPLSAATTLKEPRLVTQTNTGKTVLDVSWTLSGDVLVAAGYGKLVMYTTQGEELPAMCDFSNVEHRVMSVAVHQPQSTVALIAGLPYLHLYITPRRVCSLPRDCSMATFTAGGDVLVCRGDRLLKYNTEGTKLWERQTKNKAQFITTTPDNWIIISGDKQLSVHDKDGWWVSFFPRDTATLRHPTGVCADSSGHVFVADRQKRAILMYMPDGTYVREVFKTKTSRMSNTVGMITKNVKYPVYLASNSDRYLVVVLKDDKHYNDQLQVYDMTP